MERHATSFDMYHRQRWGYIKDIEELFSTAPANKVLSLYAHNSVKGKAIDSLRIKHGTVKVLDVGCGYGFLFQKLLARYSKIAKLEMHGTDISPFAIENAIRNVPGAAFYTCAAEDLPFKNGYFENVISSEVIEHVADPQKVMYELARVTAEGGVVTVTTPNYTGYSWSILRFLRRHGSLPLLGKLRRYLQKYSDFSVKDEHIPLPRLKQLLKQSNLSLVKVIYLMPLPEQNLLFPKRANLWRILIKTTRFLERIPLLNRYSCHQVVLVSEKRVS